ncbi:Malonyl-CoA decarboxylase (MCD) [Chelatococcus sambhunathii]|uniref:Malonyl-CoA decarboxylase (MCD) n=1 Tax=Chelatococcus sambhunathii TaxID=363953 RepID=A0ABP2A2G7_9HYPH|nr:malonyl-CoA decarboxylase [Chelatococcus sambhunathii]CUA85502.1 Malonyl-CoA decarboxylase (MCD) [Chelatococcus sambhunathii]
MPNSFFNELLQQLSERGRAMLGLARDAAARGDVVELSEHLLSGRGEASGVALAKAVLDTYANAPLATRLAFLTALAERFGADPQKVEEAITAYREKPDAATLHRLHTAAEARRQELMRRLNLAPGGTAALVRMREELIEHLPNRPDLRAVDADFVHLFSSWFNRGFLVLRPIDWTTPANILEKIIRYEAVHEIHDWDDLRRRLEPPDRRCFAFFHPQLVDEPLIFVEVALTAEIPGAIAPLLAKDRKPIAAEAATTAVFYSISNTQRGLGGVSFGNFLIKQVVDDLKRDLPNLKTFVTLSPVPGFAKWLERERGFEASQALDAEAKTVLAALDEEGWHEDPATAEKVRKVLLPAAAWYFLKAKTPNGRPVDPVARFHLGNGARLERLNFLGDTSAKGLGQAHGLMVNYLYALEDIEKNHEAFAGSGEVIAAAAVRKQLKGERASRTLVPVTD